MAWLALREPADHAARSPSLAARFAAAQGPAPYVVDLGAGSGSNLRYLAPLLPPAQRWLLVDHDPALLAAAAARTGAAGNVACLALDLARELPAVPGRTGVAAAALLDLTAAAWLDELARWCGDAPVLMALSVDGRLVWQPEDPDDDAIRRHFFAHQRADKGFGPALGPDAAAHLARRLEAAGRRVFLERSDWRLGPEHAPLLGATLDGMVAAVREIAGPSTYGRWAALRRRQIVQGRCRLTVGHIDLLASSPERAAPDVATANTLRTHVPSGSVVTEGGRTSQNAR
jgi:SAM-dependent methyltransferase